MVTLKILCRLIAAGLVVAAVPAHAQSLHTAVSTQMKINNRLNATAHLSHRTYDKFQGTSRYALSLSANYTFSPHLSAAAGTAIVMNHAREKDIEPDQMRPAFWQPRWRTFVSISPRISFCGFNAFYRSRLQVLVKSDKTVSLVPSGDPYFIDGETTFTWSHRLYAEHPFRRFTPYVSFDLFNSLDDSFRVTHYQVAAGTYYFLTPKHRFGLFARRIFRPDGTTPADGLYVIGVTYQFRFSV